MRALTRRSSLLHIVFRVLAIVAMTLPLAPQPAVTAQAVIPQVDSCPDSLRLGGPTDGSPGSQYPFTATATGASGLLSIAIEWYQDGVLKITDPTNPSTQEFSWAAGGIKSISATVRASITGRTCPPITTERSIAISPLPLSDVPLESYRLAAQLLEEQRAVAPNWADASLVNPLQAGSDGEVTPLYRPGITGPAYYEFQVFGPTDPNTLRGFIIVSTGDHDHPIPNWSTGWDYAANGPPEEDYVGYSPTRRMRMESGGTADKFYKLDSLSYVAEDINAVPAGTPVASRGTLPPKVNWPAGWADNPPPLVTTNSVPALMAGVVDPVDGSTILPTTEVVTPTVEIPANFLDPLGWGSWSDLKSGYTANYAPLIQALAQSAAPEWEALALQSEYGYVLRKGESVSYPLLRPVTNLVHEGDAYTQILVTVTPPAEGDANKALLYTAVDDVFNQGVPMQTTITYEGGATEIIRVMVVNEPEYRVYLPLVTRGGVSSAGVSSAGVSSAGTAAAPAPAALPTASAVEPQAYTPGTLGADGYTYWFVGGTQAEADAQQPWYKQFDEDLSCKSGCGPTAWAMLIAWGDRSAHAGTNSFWAGRTGLYRKDGGRGDPINVAPHWWDDVKEGVGVRNMIKEIRTWVYTFCNAFNDSGATIPATMALVGDYLNGRSGVNTRTWYLPAGFSVTGADGDTVRSAARNVLQNAGDTRRPTVIGTGFLSHYPLAYGYRSKTQQTCMTTYSCPPGGCKWVTTCTSVLLKGFYVNQGWGDGAGEWVSTDIWFTGRLSPQPAGTNDIGFYRTADDTAHFDIDHDGAGQFSFKYAATVLPVQVRPAVGDFDRDGMVDDLAHFVRSEFFDTARRYDWLIDIDTNNSIDRTLDRPIANPGGWPVVLDHNRDGFVDDPALYAPDTYSYGYMCYDDYCQGYATGGRYLLPVSGDFDRDGDHDDLAFYEPATRAWVFDLDHDNDWDGGALPWPSAAQVGPDTRPIAGDFDLDGVADDIGLFDPAYQKWWFDYNHNGVTDDTITGWGTAGDQPFAGSFWQN